MDMHQIIMAATEAVQHAAQTSPSLEAEEGVLGTLGINGKLFLAQLVNFTLVLLIVWRWIVRPLAKTLTDRQQKIEQGLKNASYMEEEKKRFEIWKQSEMKKVRSETDNLMRTASDTAGKIKQETISEATKQSANMIHQARASIEAEKDNMVRSAKQEIATLVVAASEKILRSKLDEKKDKKLVNESLKGVR